MQYKVPQNVDIEDKVIAGLTLRQFMFILVAGGFGLLEYFALTGPLNFLFIPIAIITAGIGIAFAFVKINDRPFEIFIVSALKSLFSPHIRVWRKDDDQEIPKHTETPHTRKKVIARKKSIGEIKSGLERLAVLVDSGGVVDREEGSTRQTNVTSNTRLDPSNIEDVLAKTEEASPSVDAIMVQAKEYVDRNKKEQPVSAMATNQTKPSDFKYDKLELADEKKLTETMEKVHKRQEQLEERLEQATVEKFKR